MGKKYKVVSPFRDLKDSSKQFPDGRKYAVGDVYKNLDRVDELLTDKNKLRKVLIEEVKEDKPKAKPKAKKK